jgi:hypothetical protein
VRDLPPASRCTQRAHSRTQNDKTTKRQNDKTTKHTRTHTHQTSRAQQ